MTEVTAQNTNGQGKRVVVAMSGGVDSSVAAALLVDQGYDVIGMMMRLWSEESPGTSAVSNRCCTPDQMADARRVADRLGIPFYVVDVRQQFRRSIVQFFVDQHEAGRTPNPCVECNRQIRFTYLLERAVALKADFLATGHYARVRRAPSGYRLVRGRDENKDQSYVLHTFRQDQLAHVLFPVGEYTKAEVRGLASEFRLPVASKHESQDLCFLKDGDYRRFLRDHSSSAHKPGPILDEGGRELGRHEGMAFYTIGQRKGLGIATLEPMFVIRKDNLHNALIVGPRHRLEVRELRARNVNWIAGLPPAQGILAQVKIRYKSPPIEAVVESVGDGEVIIRFREPVLGATPGQAAVFYDDEFCLGGGIIVDSETTPDAQGQGEETLEVLA